MHGGPRVKPIPPGLFYGKKKPLDPVVSPTAKRTRYISPGDAGWHVFPTQGQAFAFLEAQGQEISREERREANGPSVLELTATDSNAVSAESATTREAVSSVDSGEDNGSDATTLNLDLVLDGLKPKTEVAPAATSSKMAEQQVSGGEVGALCVWSQEIDGEGKRRYIVASRHAFWRRYRTLRPALRHYYEVSSWRPALRYGRVCGNTHSIPEISKYARDLRQ